MTREEAAEAILGGAELACPCCEGMGWRTPQDPKQECAPCGGWGRYRPLRYVEACQVLGLLPKCGYLITTTMPRYDT